MKNNNIYLDSHASTRVDQDVLKAMLPYFTEHYGNGNHRAGWVSNAAVEKARFQVGKLLGARTSEIVFTSGATEAINLGLFGFLETSDKKRNHIVTQKTEHSAMLKCMRVLEQKGYRLTMLDVDNYGRIDLEELKLAISDETLLVSIMLANNEIGTVQPIEEVGKLCRAVGARFFCDLTQGLGWHDIDVDRMKIDLACLSAHKIYGPKGVGALFVRRDIAKADMSPILFGGGQERGFRPGTCNVPGIVGLGKACDLLLDEAGETFAHIRQLRDRLYVGLSEKLQGIQLNGCPDSRHPGNLNISIPGVTGEDLIGALPNLIFSTSSACASGSAKPSHVVDALNVSPDVLNGSFRMGVGKYNTMEEIDYAVDAIAKVAHRLQERRGVVQG